MKSYRPWNPLQGHLLPPSPSEWLPDGHLAYFILDLLGELDLGGIVRTIDARDARGEKPYSPYMMTALILYAYCVGVFSSRRIERATYEDVAFRVLSGDQQPHFTRIADFRRRHLESLEQLFGQVLRLCQRAGLVSLGHVAIDGTKVQANASKHKAMSYARMKKAEKRLQREIAELFERAEQIDAEEDQRYGVGQRPEDLPEELRRRESRLAKIRQAKQELEREAQRTRRAELEAQAEGHRQTAASHPDSAVRKRAATNAEKAEMKARSMGNDDDPPAGAPGPDGLQTRRTPAAPDGAPRPKAQRNFTDPDSHLMTRDGAFVQAYNCQLAVDGDHQVIVAAGVTNQPPDNAHLTPVLESVRRNCGQTPDVATADSGYWRSDHVAHADRAGIDVYIAVDRHRHEGRAPPKPAEDAGTERAKMRQKVASDEGKKHYKRRKAIVEPVNGQIKEARGFRRFLLRGLTKVSREWTLVATTHNILKLYRSGAMQST